MNSKIKKQIISTVAPAITSLQLHRFFRPFCSGLGHVLTFHRIVPEDDQQRIHNHRSLEISPEQLEETIIYFKKQKYHFYSMEGLYEILTSGQPEEPFVVFTFDDGYKDNFEYAYPILKKYAIPFCIYITTCLPDEKLIVWWYMLEDLLREHDDIRFEWNAQQYVYKCRTINEKETAFDQIRSLINQAFSIDNHQEMLKAIFGDYELDLMTYSKNLGMSWAEIKEMASDDLVTIGAHTVNHFPLSKLDDRGLELEIICSREILEDKIKQTVEHFAYPFGKSIEASEREFAAVKKAGFKTGVTTRIGNIFQEHSTMLECLPRISINQATRRSVLKLQTSGMLHFLYNRGKRIV